MSEQQTPCCTKLNINRMDYKNHIDGGYTVINRICLACGHHWHGKQGEEKQYTRSEWDQFTNKVLTCDAPNA